MRRGATKIEWMARIVSTMVDKSDWNAIFYVAIGGDAHVHALKEGWPEDVTIALTDAPDAALTCDPEAPGAIQRALSSKRDQRCLRWFTSTSWGLGQHASTPTRLFI